MKKRNATRCYGISTHRKVKSELARLRESLRQEKRKALVCAAQRDYHVNLVQYLEEFVLTASPATFENCRQQYQLFLAKEYAQYKAEVKILREGYKTAEMMRPYPSFGRERQAIRQAGKA